MRRPKFHLLCLHGTDRDFPNVPLHKIGHANQVVTQIKLRQSTRLLRSHRDCIGKFSADYYNYTINDIKGKRRKMSRINV